VRDQREIRHSGNSAEVNAEADIRMDLALIYQDSADSRPVERELAADGRPRFHRRRIPVGEWPGDPGTFERRHRRKMIPGQTRHKISLPKSSNRQFSVARDLKPGGRGPGG
jgi:hypothetical protein